MTTVYKFKAGYTKLGVGTVPSSAPTVTIIKTDNTILVNAQTATALSNLTGAYIYSYSGADGLDLIGKFTTTDATMDALDIFVIAEYTPVDIWSYVTRTATSGNITVAEIWDALLTSITTSASIGKLLKDNINATISSRTTLGAGSISCQVLVNDGTNPLDSVDVWITSDISGTNVIARGNTDDNGIITFMLDAGTFYVWKQLAGYSFTNPETTVVV